VEDLDLRVFRFTHYGKNRIKTFNVSPDVYIQLMLQWTYYKLVFYFYFKFSRQDLGIFESGGGGGSLIIMNDGKQPSN
jgi:choline O-acetyltransferase